MSDVLSGDMLVPSWPNLVICCCGCNVAVNTLYKYVGHHKGRMKAWRRAVRINTPGKQQGTDKPVKPLLNFHFKLGLGFTTTLGDGRH